MSIFLKVFSFFPLYARRGYGREVCPSLICCWMKCFIYLGAGHFNSAVGKLLVPRPSNLSIVPERE